MALEVNATNQVEVAEPKVVATDKTRIRKVLFDFDDTTALANVSFGSGDPFVAKSSELWFLSGPFYETAITTAPTGSTSAEVLLTAVGEVVVQIQETNGLKDQLIASGELKISQGNILDFVK